MKSFVVTLLIILFIMGCEDDSKEKNGKDKNYSIINKIEQNITNNKSSLGCGDSDSNELKECKEEKVDYAKFILDTLEKKSDIEGEDNISSIKNRLNSSLEKIMEEKSKKNRIKDDLENLVNELSENRKDKLKEFLNEVNDNNFSKIQNIKINTIKNNLNLLIEGDKSSLKSKEIKKDLESIISDVAYSTNSLSETEKSIRSLVKDIDNRDSPSVEKFTNAIITDISSKKIRILKDNENSITIKVESGDNLSSLAKRYYNDSNKYRVIYEANKDKINENYEIYPNSELVIPKIK